MVRVVLHDGESLENALHRLDRALFRQHHRPWYKNRYGYYEKPSRLRRKYRRMRTHNLRRAEMSRMFGLPYCPAIFRIDLAAMFARTGPNAMGH